MERKPQNYTFIIIIPLDCTIPYTAKSAFLIVPDIKKKMSV